MAPAPVEGQKTLPTYWQRLSVPDPGSGPSVSVVVDHDGHPPPPIVKQVALQVVEVHSGTVSDEDEDYFGEDPSFDAVLMELADETESDAQAARWIAAGEHTHALALEHAADLYRLAHCYGLGDEVERDIARAIYLLWKAALTGDGPAWIS